MKYDDANQLANPLYGKPTQQKRKTIASMIWAKRYPVPEVLIHVPENYDLFIDSFIQSAYLSEEEDKWANYVPDLEAPAASLES